MVYIRIKNINKNKYAYAVESIKTSKGSRQKVKEYLGRVFELETKHKVKENEINSRSAKEFLVNLIVPYLISFGFVEKEKKYVHKNMIFSSSTLALTTKSTQKNIVLKNNDGYLCAFSLVRILKFKKSKDVRNDAKMLATYFHGAGLQVSKEQFVAFYQLLN
jgi:hypothetical protein